MANMLIAIGTRLLSALATDIFIKEVVIRLAKEIAKKTQNHVDDDIVQYVENAWKNVK